ncbi:MULTISPECIES: arsenate reductase (glutaredoxin) [unclassified Polaribacter]|uniref:arsenate reductase (glutaredoxin) n=1 Tax=unclassified Polaribacter TaxID=196858 RepID=UPI0011BE78AD|nr:MULTISPECIES: arsenate reductase (glutaredoxin) [unclassified Polaribacter]TXD52900.1 arsenate reductase (glutaredoxin) [Polaribacter sp. IC063]TXD60846.1 arsenate reductase (glutaredoxin) [Polaribacter sp. IC066]
MIKIYHNPRCKKSREGLALIENSGKKFEIIKYLEDVPTEKELTEIIEFLHISPIQLIRKTEKVWKEAFKGKDLSDSEIIKAMIQNPKLIERPIVIHKNKAVIGRPSENIMSIL